MRRPGVGEALLMTSALTMVAACSGDETPAAQTDHERNTTCLANGLDQRQAENVLPVPGEAFRIRATYSTDYDVDEWRIMDPKTLGIMLEPIPIQEGEALPQILVENLHAEARVKSDESGLNNLLVDSFDDHLHAGDQPGFAISQDYAYREVFAIEGESDTFREGWNYQISGYGDLDADATKSELNESVLRHYGAYGQEVSFVVDLLVRENPDDLYRKTVISDRILVPLEGHECGQEAATSTSVAAVPVSE